MLGKGELEALMMPIANDDSTKAYLLLFKMIMCELYPIQIGSFSTIHSIHVWLYLPSFA